MQFSTEVEILDPSVVENGNYLDENENEFEIEGGTEAVLFDVMQIPNNDFVTGSESSSIVDITAGSQRSAIDKGLFWIILAVCLVIGISTILFLIIRKERNHGA